MISDECQQRYRVSSAPGVQKRPTGIVQCSRIERLNCSAEPMRIANMTGHAHLFAARPAEHAHQAMAGLAGHAHLAAAGQTCGAHLMGVTVGASVTQQVVDQIKQRS